MLGSEFHMLDRGENVTKGQKAIVPCGNELAFNKREQNKLRRMMPFNDLPTPCKNLSRLTFLPSLVFVLNIIKPLINSLALRWIGTDDTAQVRYSEQPTLTPCLRFNNSRR